MSKEKKQPAAEEAEAVKEAETVQEEAEAAAAEEAETGAEAETEAPAEAEAEDLQKKVDDLNDRLLRTLAEYDNFRRRSQKEKEALYGDTKAETVSKFLPVIDNFARAAEAEADLDSYKKGIEMTVKQLFDVLSGLGVEAFGEAGEPFDPLIHNGVMHVEDPELGENVIAEVFMKGYKMGDRVIRHATVKVAN